ncbi:PEP-CTERM sorting domain-containing protein [Rubritalea marina]|uniref:PEP-CTERM sorting domain-containing protein n=1 Tax=Rubritalea marina TaxID=361055 RepID=UPI0003721FDE|nr:PEP-CTERM sorting domain-containing protein [Rubritalea marina]
MKRILPFLLVVGMSTVAPATVTLHTDSQRTNHLFIDTSSGASLSELHSIALWQLDPMSSCSIIELKPRTTGPAARTLEPDIYHEMVLDATAVPEPSTTTFLMGSLGFLLSRRRRTS